MLLSKLNELLRNNCSFSRCAGCSRACISKTNLSFFCTCPVLFCIIPTFWYRNDLQILKNLWIFFNDSITSQLVWSFFFFKKNLYIKISFRTSKVKALLHVRFCAKSLKCVTRFQDNLSHSKCSFQVKAFLLSPIR